MRIIDSTLIPNSTAHRWYIYAFCLLVFSGIFHISCQVEEQGDYNIYITDPDLELELVANDQEIATPIGMAIDKDDNLYILESHTHTTPKDYAGPNYDRIKKSVDENKDGIPESWIVYADSIEDGMNLSFDESNGLLLSTKNSISRYHDLDGDGISDIRTLLIDMYQPQNAYDHAAILGVTIGQDGWIYFSRGNVNGAHWKIRGADGSEIEGYGDGGNVMRCRSDGSNVEEIATGFWNPFDIKFSREGRLFVTDNDPDSRGPNRLIEIVPGGDYGYKSLYGSTGIHPYLSWNGELPGTLPFAAPLGEAPCGMIDAGLTNLGSKYQGQIFVNIWEESNIVHIPLTTQGSTVLGKPKVLVQGGSDFHPVALATNSHGDLYISDWVLRQYPNHGKGRIWRIRSAHPILAKATNEANINRFAEDDRDVEELVAALEMEDVFEQNIARYYLAKRASPKELIPYLSGKNKELKLQILLTFFKKEELLSHQILTRLLSDSDLDIQRMTLIYIGTKGIPDMRPALEEALQQNNISTDLFDTYLSTIRQLQPEFIKQRKERTEYSAKKIPRKLPDNFIYDILKDNKFSESIKAKALTYLQDFPAHQSLLTILLKNANEPILLEALINSIRNIPGNNFDDVLKNIVFDNQMEAEVRAMALMELSIIPDDIFNATMPLLTQHNEVLQYAVLKYLCATPPEENALLDMDKWVKSHEKDISKSALAVWENCQDKVQKSFSDDEWSKAVDNSGNTKIGKLVFENKRTVCSSCHKLNGWGGTFGPDLSRIGSSKSKSQLVMAILDPSMEISPEWQGWFLVDQTGLRHIGRQIDVGEGFAKLMNTEGNFDKYDNPTSYGAMEQSVMPDGLEQNMTLDEFNHLIAYLSSLK